MRERSIPTVSVIYHFFPHYRAPVLRELARSQRYNFIFYGGVETIEGIVPFCGDDAVTIYPLKTTQRGRFFFVSGFWSALFDKRASALIIIGNPNIPATWLIALGGKVLRKKVIYWTHGWLYPEQRFKAFVRNLYFSLADRVMVYGERARELADASGFPRKRISVIYNSLDWIRSEELFAQLQATDEMTLRREVTEWPELPLLICTARLTKICRFDLLLEAMAIMERRGFPTSLILVGDGPERVALERKAADLTLRVLFKGAVYEEEEISRLIYASDLTVSPGKVGLTAMHSLSYGTPVVTQGDLNSQMPEVEAVHEGITGTFFRRGSAEDLARAILDWLCGPKDRAQTRRACRAEISERWNPSVQRERIEAALDDVFGAAG